MPAPTVTVTIDTGTCLMCPAVVALLPHGAISDHQDPDGAPCPGSGHARRFSDGKDDTRRHAIRQYHSNRAQADARRADFLSDAGGSWTISDAVLYHYNGIAVHQTAARLWKDLAIHGDWWTTFRTAMVTLTRPASVHGETLVIDGAIGGARAWMSAARTDLINLTREMGSAGDILADLIYTV